jgi:hypothetical protein
VGTKDGFKSAKKLLAIGAFKVIFLVLFRSPFVSNNVSLIVVAVTTVGDLLHFNFFGSFHHSLRSTTFEPLSASVCSLNRLLQKVSMLSLSLYS